MNHVRPHKLNNARSQTEQHLREILRDRIMGFRTTQMIHVAAKLGLADRLAAGPRSADDLAAAVGAEPQALHRLLRAHPHLGGILFDLPSVVAGAMQMLGETRIAGDFFDEAPAGADLYVMKSVLHNWEDGDAVRILSTCRAAMKADARLLVIERVVPPGNVPAEAKLFDINMLVVAGGRERGSPQSARPSVSSRQHRPNPNDVKRG